MTDRVIDLSDRPAHLGARNGLLVVRLENEPEITVPFADVAVVITSHPQISYTHAVLAGLAEAGAMFVACDAKHMPAAMLLPLVSHHLQTERFAVQAKLALPVAKRLWQQIAKEKILAQARLLEERTGQDWGLKLMAGRIRSGDAGNLESHAARVYWKALFGEMEFRRDRDAEDLNRHLNYGYAVLRAIVARALCGAGLHPTFGLHHHNRYDAFCLADDLMEPFRPLVDRVVARLSDSMGSAAEFDREAKRALLEPLLGRYDANGESRSLFDWVSRCAFSLAAVVDGREKRLEIPRLCSAGL
ncbi:MAG TPA: type II CRISPR-associated endonuclease Cas1 [Terriglobia bacterium]|nr:type II CRISPR-associated endonuclease Cas1 [Terriglobia bacterium]